MADVIAECKERTYDFSWLPATLGDFKLVIPPPMVCIIAFFIMKMNWGGAGKLYMMKKLMTIPYM